MSKYDYFRARAAAYRKMAMEAKDAQTSNDMNEIAAVFNCIADTCDEQRPASPLHQRLFSKSLLVRRLFAR